MKKIFLAAIIPFLLTACEQVEIIIESDNSTNTGSINVNSASEPSSQFDHPFRLVSGTSEGSISKFPEFYFKFNDVLSANAKSTWFDVVDQNNIKYQCWAIFVNSDTLYIKWANICSSFSAGSVLTMTLNTTIMSASQQQLESPATKIFQIEASPISISETSSIGVTVNSTPIFTFTSNVAGQITHTNCTDVNTTINAGLNIIELHPTTSENFQDGLISDCFITVMDANGNSATLNIQPFTVDSELNNIKKFQLVSTNPESMEGFSDSTSVNALIEFDQNSTVKFIKFNDEWQTWTNTPVEIILQEGLQTVTVFSKGDDDKTDNATATITVDTQAPTTTLVVDNETYDNTTNIQIVTDADFIMLDNVWTNVPDNITWTLETVGENSISIMFKDKAGNISTASTQVTLKEMEVSSAKFHSQSSYNGSFYAISRFPMTWTAARDFIAAENGELVTIINNNEKLFLEETYKTYNQRYWIGLYDGDDNATLTQLLSNGTNSWSWLNESTFIDWAINPKINSKRCAVIFTGFIEESCSDAFYAIGKWPSNPNITDVEITRSNGSIDGSSNDDFFLILKDTTGNIELGAGDDFLQTNGDIKHEISMGDGDNVLLSQGNLEKSVSFGDGDNILIIQDEAGSKQNISFGSANSTGSNYVSIGGEIKKSVEFLGVGDDTLIAYSDIKQEISFAGGNNTAILLGDLKFGATFGDGNDFLAISGEIKKTISMGGGDDTVEIIGQNPDVKVGKSNYVDGGDNEDTLILQITKDDWISSGMISNFINFETVRFTDQTCNFELSICQ